MREILSCIIILCAVGAAESYNASYHSSDFAEGNWTQLLGENVIISPEISMSNPETNWTYPFNEIPVYSKGKKISGIFFGSGDLANTTAEICTSPLSFSDFLRAVGVIDQAVNLSCEGYTFNLNDSGDANFTIPGPGTTSGLYALYVIDRNASIILSAAPFIVSEEDLSVEVPSELQRGFPLELNLKIANQSDRPVRYGALLMPLKDYKTMKLEVTSNETLKDIEFDFYMGSAFTEIPGDFDLSMDILFKILMLFPPNSSIAPPLEPTKKQEANLYLLTEPDWESETYILTSVVLCDEGIVGLDQIQLELI